MNTADTVKVLRRSAELLGERGWCQGQLENSQGQVCAMGAFEWAANELFPTIRLEDGPDAYFASLDDRQDLARDAIDALTEVLDLTPDPDSVYGDNPIPDWNDAKDRTVEDVILAFKRAAEHVEENREPANHR